MPTLFWCDRSWSGSKYLSENRTEISPGYTCTKAERDVRQNQVDEAVGQCLSGIDKDADDYTKIKAVFEYLVNTVDYDKNAADNQNVYSALVESVLSVQVMHVLRSFFLKSLEFNVYMLRERLEKIMKPMHGISSSAMESIIR